MPDTPHLHERYTVTHSLPWHSPTPPPPQYRPFNPLPKLILTFCSTTLHMLVLVCGQPALLQHSLPVFGAWVTCICMPPPARCCNIQQSWPMKRNEQLALVITLLHCIGVTTPTNVSKAQSCLLNNADTLLVQAMCCNTHSWLQC